MTMTDRVRGYLRSHEAPIQARQQEFSKTVFLAAVTVRHRLKQEGTTWQTLVDAEARRRTDAMLQEGVKGTAIAYAVGYTERQSFFRAVRRWYGAGYSQIVGGVA